MPFSTTSESFYAESSSSSARLEISRTPVSALTPAVTHTTWTAPGMRMMDPMDEQLGYTFSTAESRHDGRRQSIADVPPPYAEESAIPLPEYTLHAPEPLTLAMYLFKFGFLFPPFWLFGAFILLSPLREPPAAADAVPAWMPEKTEEERKQIIATLRAVEIKWAKRCLCALLILAILALSGGMAAWSILRQH